MATKKVKETEVPEGDVIVDPKAKANFWKPTVEGESKTGKYLGKTTTTFGEVLNLDTPEGLCQIPVSIVLRKVDWDKHVGKHLFFRYDGTIKRYRTFYVSVVK